ncbi:MAG: hypothetical protein IJH84_23470 [Saccharopolyspora sp.]|uniref:SAV_915 family protein n=1 Tax=Saccharopolyspora sp. TaxID=33915 RepID=UPI0025CC8172|nr:SAV_915 family protein [Saccharopolyspora sp.]MBQ6643973.1 hypothetical protein [Saccharopolyspora sp.]
MPPEEHATDGAAVAPAVLGDEGAELFIPCARAAPHDQQVQLELRHTTENALALVTYTSLERLVEGCGDQQPWISVPSAEVQQLAEQVAAQVILQDVPLPDDQRQDSPE